MTQVNIRDAKTHLSKLIERVSQGEEFIIARAGKPVARLTTVEPVERGRRFGAMKGQATVDDRFFEPLPEEEIAAWG
jgi:prevent-host-death family protein